MEREIWRRRPNPWKRVLAGVSVLVVLCAGAAWLLLGYNRFSLELELTGAPELIIEYGDGYTDLGAVPVMRGTRFWQEGITPEGVEVQIRGQVDPASIGKYTVDYAARYFWWKAEAQRTVRVVDTVGPVITLVEGDGIPIAPGTPYPEPGFTATDNYDGDITDRVVRTEADGVIRYAVFDSSGNPAYAQREIPYLELQPPQILLEGGEAVTIPAGTVFTDPGYSAMDGSGADLADRVTVEGEVLWYVPGTYTLTYSMTDFFGNAYSAVRNVTVEALPRTETVEPSGKVIYLTFDDGPGPHTEALLEVLRKYGVKATFFVTNSGYGGVMKSIVDQGHSIGIHTMTHNYEQIYASPEAYFADLYGMQEIIYRNTGVRTTLVRFPGGSSNTVSCFNEGVMTLLTEAVQDAGFQYFDWNVDSNDAGGAKKAQTVLNNVAAGVSQNRISVVLQHDIHPYSVEAVEDIIIWGRDNGYSFLPLKPDSPPMHHGVNN